MKGKLIIIEGVDSSGKATHAKMLYERLLGENNNVKKVEFPNYSSQSSALVKMYLNGDFGDKPEDVNPYAASVFFAIDRFASYRTLWKNFYDNGGIVVSDRYTMSNMIHQAAKIIDSAEKKAFLDWLWDLEFVKLGIPVPDSVIFLDMPPEYAISLMKDRKNKFTGQNEKDIHENNIEYLLESYYNACDIAKLYDWNRVYCVKDGKIKDIADIHKDIYSIVKQVI
ncbi:MAG: deoxynucleoside kinase [Clostridiaceae bacterium]|nr:deoxynucleoside kinase [Clostridiaceae bacterium]